jgi:hypothetical protein
VRALVAPPSPDALQPPAQIAATGFSPPHCGPLYCMPIFRHLLKPIYYTAMLEMKRITT